MSDTSNIGYGLLDPTDFAGDYNSLSFIIQQALGAVRTMVPVKVLSIAGGGVGPPPVVSVQPLVKMVDGVGNATSHGQIFNIPVFRYQGQYGAIIIDPKVGDVGMLVVADRDISSVQATNGQESTPGSWRTHDLADGIFIGGLFGGTPTAYVWFSANGVTISDANGNTIAMSAMGIAMTAVAVTISGNLQLGGSILAAAGGEYAGNIQTTGNILIGGSMEAAGGVIAGAGTGDQVGLQTHKHSGVATGGGESGGAVPGT
jgi:Phage protein Gp138 N-terminal domain